MTRPFFSSIRFRLLLLIVIASLPALGLVFYIAQEQRTNQIMNIRQTSLWETKRMAATVARIIENTRTVLLATADVLDAHENDPAFALAHLTVLLKAFPYYNNVATTDQHGNLKLTVLPSSGPVNYADRLWFKRVVQTKDFSIGEYVFGRITKAHIITLAYPIINKQGQLRGTIFVSLDLTWLYNQLNPLSMPKDSSLTILDSKGVVLVVIPDQGKWVGKPFPESTLLRNILSRPQGTEESKGIDGVGRIVSYTSVHGTAGNMFVSYGIAKDNALASINRTLMRNMALLLFVFVLSIIGVIFFGNVFILQKVRKLVTASERLGHGDFKARTDLPYRGDELSQVAEALDKMAVNIEKHDIERKQAEEALWESENNYRSLFQNASIGIFHSIPDGRFLRVNPALAEMMGYVSPEEMISSITDINTQIYVGSKKRSDIISKTFKSAGWLYAENLYRRKDGTIITANLTLRKQLNPDGTLVYLEGFVEDITERKQAEEALKDSEEKIRDIFDTMSEGVALNEIVYNENREMSDYRIIEVNRAYYSIADYAPGEVIGNVATKLYGISPELIKSFFESHIKNTAVVHTEMLSPLNNKWHAIATSPIKDGRFVTSFSDITDRKRGEAEKQILEERLQRSEKMEALGTLAGGVAYDLNNVLGIIVGYSELVLDGVDESSPVKPSLVNIMNGGLKAAAIVDDLLALARRGVQGRTIINLNKVVADCQRSPEFANLSNYHPLVRIITDLETDLLNISGSSVHLGKSLYNLVSNASEAMPKGGTVTIKTANQYLDKPIHGYDEVRQGDYVVLSVSDMGEGISENNMKRIFEPFYTKKIMGRSGTGLGLAVVWGTVKDHNGYINVESEEGKGSIFTLYFPVTRADITTEATAIPIAQYMGNGESILVVDDVKEQRELAVSLLGPLNYKLTSVASGEEAVAYLKTHEVDLMLLDMIMDPGMDGLDTYRQVLEIRPNQKAIIVSGFSESNRVKTSEDLGVGAYLRKPYIKEKLGLAVRKELDRVV